MIAAAATDKSSVSLLTAVSDGDGVGSRAGNDSGGGAGGRGGEGGGAGGGGGEGGGGGGGGNGNPCSCGETDWLLNGSACWDEPEGL